MADISLQTLLIYLGIGSIMGMLLGSLLKGNGFGWFGNLCLGILGACLGGLVATFAAYTIANDPVRNAIAAVAGTVLLTLIFAIFKRR